MTTQPETASSARAEISEDGTGHVTLEDGTRRTINAQDLDSARAQATTLLINAAKTRGQDIHATMYDPWGTWPIIIRPTGAIVTGTPIAEDSPGTPAPVPLQPPTPEATAQHQPTPVVPHENNAWNRQGPTTNTPSTWDGPSNTQPAATDQWTPQPQQARHGDTPQQHPQSQPTRGNPFAESAATTPPAATQAPVLPREPAFEWEQDPAWQQEAAKPATQGFRAMFKLKPGLPELQERRKAFAQAKEDQRRDEDEAKRRQEEEAKEDAQRAKRRKQRAAERDAHRATLNRSIQTNFQGTQTILVANPKGGARKTTTAYVLAATIGSTRGGSTVAWDANETMGTLGERSQPDRHNRTVVDLLENGAQHFLDISSARVGVLDHYVRTQGDAHFDVLASDENPNRQDQIDAEGFNKVHDILAHFYRMIVVDTGNNIRAPHFIEAQGHTNQLVIPVAASHDSKNRALDMISAFTVAGYDYLVANAVVLVHELEPVERDDQGNAISGGGHELTAAEIATAFERHVRTVLPIPYDARLKDGGVIDYFELAPATIDAYREAAAAITDALGDARISKDPGKHAPQSN